VRSKSLYLLLLIAIFGLNQRLPAAESGAGSQKPQKIAQKNTSDAVIEAAIQAKLAKSKLAADHFTVSVKNGVATIDGSTGVMQHKGVMTRMAKTAGATSVRNNIRISAEAKAKATASLAKARAKKTAGAPKRPANSAPAPGAENTPQVPHAQVLPMSIGR